MKKLSSLMFVSGLIGILLLGVLWATAAQAESKKKFTLEVAMGDAPPGLNFVGPPPPPPPGTRGVVVLSSGNIFAEGTLDSFSDPNSAEAIGIWRCHLIDLGQADFDNLGVTGAVTYFFQLESDDDSEGDMIIVQGLNSHPSIPGVLPPVPDVDNSEPRVHAVVGGTGKYAGATGVVTEEVFGTNLSGNRNLRFDFRLRGVDDDDDDDDDDD